MKPFNLEDAKKGCPVCTRNGRKARIICYDCKGKYPIIALLDENCYEISIKYTVKGEYSSSIACHDLDLMMAPVKHERWVNLYRYKERIFPGKKLYDTKEQAIEEGIPAIGYVTTSKIEWEENELAIKPIPHTLDITDIPISMKRIDNNQSDCNAD